MKYDREEAYLREKLTDGLHPADVDLWPAVAEHLPDACCLQEAVYEQRS